MLAVAECPLHHLLPTGETDQGTLATVVAAEALLPAVVVTLTTLLLLVGALLHSSTMTSHLAVVFPADHPHRQPVVAALILVLPLLETDVVTLAHARLLVVRCRLRRRLVVAVISLDLVLPFRALPGPPSRAAGGPCPIRLQGEPVPQHPRPRYLATSRTALMEVREEEVHREAAIPVLPLKRRPEGERDRIQRLP